MKALVLFVLLVAVNAGSAFLLFPPRPTSARVVARAAPAGDDNVVGKFVSDIEKEKQAALDTITGLIQKNKVVVFMKGSKLFPMCGFSNTAVQILRALDADFETFDVLSDQVVRDEIKAYSSWPTIPQCYVAGEFVGGSDILMEMYQSGELKKLLESAGATKQQQ